MSTKFAPAGRTGTTELERQRAFFQENNVLDMFLGKIPAIFIIINKHRQIVYMNKGALEFSGLDTVSLAIGKRPGELLDCIHSREEEDGCGASEACTFCGAVNAVLSSQKGVPAVRDARLLVGDGHQAFDLRIWAMPLEVEKEKFTAITLQDIQQEKRLLMIERVFYHDILNTITGLAGTVALLQRYKEKVNVDGMLKQVGDITQRLIDEIQSQQMLTAAEGNVLKVQVQDVTSKDIINEIVLRYTMTELAKNKKITIAAESEIVSFNSDKVIIMRILGNMVKNALEATSDGGTVTVGCKQDGERVHFWIHNNYFIPRDVQMQIFNRSFSTKGTNRGMGTYSMMLLSSFLHGGVSFTTSKNEGTTFLLELPKTIPLDTKTVN